IIAAMGAACCSAGSWAILALSDGLVWSELSAASRDRGTYAYLKEAFRGTALGGVLPFLFIWQFVLSGPLEIASGYIGFAQYAGYFWQGMGATGRLTCVAVGLLTIASFTGASGGGEAVVVLVGDAGDGAGGDRERVVQLRCPACLRLSAGCLHLAGLCGGLGSAMLIAMYDFMGYYDVLYVAGEVREPQRG
ncbi:MAG: amino acid permease, partial [Gemmatimonadetes bacterium]|nr:amino acid permease [Gemmatimonadota bacterium]